MAREKENYRDTLSLLIDKGYPLAVSNKQACEILGVSYNTFRKLIKRENFQVRNGKIPLGAIAQYACG